MAAGGRDEPRLGVVIPARNEASRIGGVLAAMPAQVPGTSRLRTYVVDDGSEDRTSAVAREHGARVIRHPINLGKGAALRTGCQGAIRDGCELLVVMDADGQHLPGDVARLVAPLLAGEADLVLTYRRFGPEMPAAMRLGNWGLSLAFRALFQRRVTDTQCGLRAFTARALPRLLWDATDYSVETEMLIRAARHRLRFTELPIETVYHDRYKGTTIGDGVRIFANMIRWALSSQ